MLGNFSQQTTSTDNIFRCIFFLGTLRAKKMCRRAMHLHFIVALVSLFIFKLCA